MPFSQAMTFSGSPTPAARRAAMPLAMAGAMKGRMRSPTAVVMISARTISSTISPPPESTPEILLIRTSRLSTSMMCTV